VCQNNKDLFAEFNIACYSPIVKEPVKDTQVENNEKPSINIDKIEDLVLNGRDEYLEEYTKIERSGIDRLIGVSRNNTYTNGKIVERDFYDLHYGYGIIGFVLILIFPLAFLLISLKDRFKKLRNIFDDINLYYIAVLLGFGIALIAGHTLFSPAVSIYLALVIAICHNKGSDMNVNEK